MPEKIPVFNPIGRDMSGKEIKNNPLDKPKPESKPFNFKGLLKTIGVASAITGAVVACDMKEPKSNDDIDRDQPRQTEVLPGNVPSPSMLGEDADGGSAGMTKPKSMPSPSFLGEDMDGGSVGVHKKTINKN